MESTEQRPWEVLDDLLVAGDAAQVEKFLDGLTPAETALAVSRLVESKRTELLSILSAEEVADMLVELPDEQAADLIEEMPVRAAAEVVELMPADVQADLLANLGRHDVEAILDAMPAEGATRARELLRFAEDTAGGLMTVRYLAYRESATVDRVVSDLRANVEKYSDYEVQYAYVVSPQGQLLGVLPMRDMLLAQGSRTIREVMIARPIHVTTDTPLERLLELFEDHASFIGIPVTDGKDRLVGVVQRAAVLEAAEHRADDSFLKLSGIVGGEEFRSMPLHQRALRRLSFLAPNILLNMLAASVIAIYQGTLEAAIALAVFLPIISDMSGCSGNQAVAVSIRELSLGLIRPGEFVRVFAKEASLGLFNGLILGLLLGGVAVLWKGNWYLGAVVGSALMLNTILSVILGGSIPLLLRRLRVDPALASSPILTTVTDMCGFFLVLSFASTVLMRL
jgi:magnesium transporter